MSTLARVIGLGHELAGDDGVGPAVLRALAASGLPAGVELYLAAEPTALIPLLDTRRPVVLVDALVGARPGAVLALTPEEVELQALTPLSTHGVGVMQAIALARTLDPAAVTPHLRLVGVGIDPPAGPAGGLSPPVAAAVPLAARTVLQILEGAARA